MDKFETSTTHANSTELHEGSTREGIRISELIARKNSTVESGAIGMLKLILEQNEHLSHVEVVFVSPEDEPDTGGFFHGVQIDEQSFVPTIFVVSENQKHLQRLKDIRRSSAMRIAEMLEIDFSQLTPNLLRQFIIAHEIGHASDYVKNYETNPSYPGVKAAEEWDMHYESNLSTMPVPGLDPVDLREEISRFSNLQAFISAHPDAEKAVKNSGIKTLQDLLSAQENAYRASAYERYADDFAVDFLKQNAKELSILELQDDEKIDLAA